MKKTANLFFTLCLLVSAEVYSQRVKYKDVYALIVKKDYEKAYPLLKIVLKSDTAIPSANLYMGSIFYDRAKSFDVLKENEITLLSSDSAFVYLSRAKRQLNDKEIKKNDDYYLGYRKSKKDTSKLISDRDTILKRIQSDIDFKLNDIDKYRKEVKYIFSSFNNSVDNYSHASSIYRVLNTKFSSIKQLCLLSDAATEKEIKSIILHYDSSIYNLEAYKKAIKVFPIKGYNQQYQIEPIETYRLDGLTMTNFLGSKLIVWNYGKWAREISSMIEKDIKKMRTSILETDELYNKTIQKIESKSISYDSAIAIGGNKKLQMLLKKYDYNSLASKILDYKQKKLEFLALTLNRYNNIDNTTTENFDGKALTLFNINQKINESDTALNKLSLANLVKESVNYQFYIDKRFADIEGLKKYIKDEQAFIALNKKEYEEKYTNVMYNYLIRFIDTTQYISYLNYSIPFFKSFDNSRSSVKTTYLQEDKKGSFYICGYINQGTSSNGFVCKLDASKQVMWFKNIATKPENKTLVSMEFASLAEPIDDGCLVSINSKLTAGGIKNNVLRFDKNGVELSNRKVEGGGVVRQMLYDEINDNYIIVSKGETPFDFIEKAEPLNIGCFDVVGNVKWVHRFNLHGNVVEFCKIFEGYLLSCNYSVLSTGANTIASKAGLFMAKSNVFLLKIGTAGQIGKYETIPSVSPIYTVGTVRIKNNINILGFNAELQPKWINNRYEGLQNKMKHIVSSNLEMLK